MVGSFRRPQQRGEKEDGRRHGFDAGDPARIEVDDLTKEDVGCRVAHRGEDTETSADEGGIAPELCGRDGIGWCHRGIVASANGAPQGGLTRLLIRLTLSSRHDFSGKLMTGKPMTGKPMTGPGDLFELAAELVERLIREQTRIVLAESCTAGLVAATLSRTPGVSAVLCGSAVTYCDETKVDWLNVSQDLLAKQTAVSAPAAAEMVSGALATTPVATLAAAVTGHLGPGAPTAADGLVFTGVGWRGTAESRVREHWLDAVGRLDRQQEAARLVITELLYEINRRGQ